MYTSTYVMHISLTPLLLPRPPSALHTPLSSSHPSSHEYIHECRSSKSKQTAAAAAAAAAAAIYLLLPAFNCSSNERHSNCVERP